MNFEGKHIFGNIGETRVTFAEKNVDSDRRDFLKSLLEHNGFEVIIEEVAAKTPEDPVLYNVAVTDMVFNPTIYVYERRLRTLNNHIVNADYWFQRETTNSPQYWEK